MPRATAPVIDLEVERVRELSKRGRYSEALAAAEALTVLAPQNRDALYLISTNQRCLNRIDEALATLRRLEEQHPRFSLLYQERGYCYTTLRDAKRAIEAFLQAVSLNPALVASWSMLARLYRITGETQHAAEAAEQIRKLQQLSPEVVRAGNRFSDGDLLAAENILREYLLHGGNNDVEALHLLARIERQSGALKDAEQRLAAVLQLAPGHRAARLDYIHVLLEQQEYMRAREEIEAVRQLEREDRDLFSLEAAACVGMGLHERAIELYGQLIADSPASGELYVALGHSLKSVGRQKEAIESYRKAKAIRPSFGDAYWSLANLKTYRFSQDEIACMRAHETAGTAGSVDRYHLCFALGKAYEDLNEYAESWQFYERGNALKRAECRYQPEMTETTTRQQIKVCTAQFFSTRADVGTPDRDPIFIVGMPRSGSTLIEQILASHPQVDGTRELHDIPRIVRGLETRTSYPANLTYPAVLADLGPENFRTLGERYLTETRCYRGTKPFFIDKMPNNFRHIGLMHLMLPNARIIDVRREPMACCFSNLKQLFASGQEFTNSIDDIGRYYRAYLDLMSHWDAVLPGRILRVFYEDVVDDLEANVRRILEFCGLGFEPACLEFYKLERSIYTASSEQVRQPIFRAGLSQWRHYKPWLESLQSALGDAVSSYRH